MKKQKNNLRYDIEAHYCVSSEARPLIVGAQCNSFDFSTLKNCLVQCGMEVWPTIFVTVMKSQMSGIPFARVVLAKKVMMTHSEFVGE